MSVSVASRVIFASWISALIGVLIATHTQMRWESWPEAIFNPEMGILVTFATVATPLAAIVGIHLLNRRTKNSDDTLRHQLELADRDQFAKGADLLASNTESARVSGIYLLHQLAEDEPRFQIPVCNTLIAFIGDGNAEAFELLADENSNKSPNWAKLTRTTSDKINALHHLGRIREKTAVEWPTEVFGTGKSATLLPVAAVALVLEDCNFSGCKFNQWHFAESTFRDCQMQNTTIEGRVNFALQFFGCDLTGAELKLRSGCEATTKGCGVLMFSDCKLDGVRLNGSALPKTKVIPLPF